MRCADDAGGVATVVQILKNDDTKLVVMTVTSGAKSLDKLPILMWALVQHGNGTSHIHPMIMLNGEVLDATELANYVGVYDADAEPSVILDDYLSDQAEQKIKLPKPTKAAKRIESVLAG